MSASELLIGGHYYLPFWVVHGYLDTPDEPFIKCELLSLTQSDLLGDDGTIEEIDTCAVQAGPRKLTEVPRNFLVPGSKLVQWSECFADWFTGFAKREEK